MTKNVFVLCTDEFNLIKLHSLQRAQEHEFHRLLDYSDIRASAQYDLPDLLRRANAQLRAFDGRIDGIVGYFDFPVTDMIPILARQHGLRSASLEAVLKCEHKYWSRIEQQRAVPEHVPAFTAFDPFAEDALDRIGIDFPFWIKPIKSFRSFLGFRIGSQRDFEHAIAVIRQHIGGIAEPFDAVLEHATLPPEIADIAGHYCMAEAALEGHQCTLEGYVCDGEFRTVGVVDSIRDTNRSTFARYEYPSQLPLRVQSRMSDIAGRIIKAIGFDNACFNMEFFYSAKRDSIGLLEINPRISQSHGDLFQKVDGDSHHQIMIDIAVGETPLPPHREGPFGHAAKFMLRHFEDAYVQRVPDELELQACYQRFPGTLVEVNVRPGLRLSELLNQDSYSYELADIYMGAATSKELHENYNALLELLAFELEPVT